MIKDWLLPNSDAERRLLVKELEDLRMPVDNDPKLHFAEFDARLTVLESVGITYSEKEIVSILRNTLSSQYDTEARSSLQNKELTRHEFEGIMRNSYAERKIKERQKPATGGLGPHALVVGGRFRQGNGGGRGRHGRGGFGGGGRAQQ